MSFKRKRLLNKPVLHCTLNTPFKEVFPDADGFSDMSVQHCLHRLAAVSDLATDMQTLGVRDLEG